MNGVGEKKKRGRIWPKVVIALIVIILLFLCLIGFITDFLWFRELDYVSVFFTKLFTQLKIGIPTFIIVTFLAYVYLKFLKRGYFKKVTSDEVTDHRKLNLISWGLAGIYGAVTTFFAVTQLWFQMLQFTNSTDFGKSDPLYGKDISFYVFRLDFIEELNQLVIVLLVAFAALTFIYYTVLLSVRTPQVFENVTDDTVYEEDTADETTEQSQFGGGFDNINDMFGHFARNFTGGRQKPFKRKTRTHRQFDNENLKILLSIAEKQLIIVGVLFFLMVGVHFFLKQYDLLFGSTGAVYGAGFTDVNVTLWVYRIIMALSVLAAIGVVFGMKRKKLKPALISPVIMIAVGVLGIGAAIGVQNLIVNPDEINKESKYLEHNIDFTQDAYGLNNVDTRDFAATSDLTSEDIANNSDTISNIRINDYEPAQTFYNQTQSIRQYYTFNDVDIDRYYVNGEYTQTFLSAREIDEERISDTWLNRHLKYTHG